MQKEIVVPIHLPVKVGKVRPGKTLAECTVEVKINTSMPLALAYLRIAGHFIVMAVKAAFSIKDEEA